jgi:hypothetical protein
MLGTKFSSSTVRNVLKYKSLFSTAVAVPEYATSVKFFHWTMGGSMLAAVGKL